MNRIFDISNFLTTKEKLKKDILQYDLRRKADDAWMEEMAELELMEIERNKKWKKIMGTEPP